MHKTKPPPDKNFHWVSAQDNIAAIRQEPGLNPQITNAVADVLEMNPDKDDARHERYYLEQANGLVPIKHYKKGSTEALLGELSLGTYVAFNIDHRNELTDLMAPQTPEDAAKAKQVKDALATLSGMNSEDLNVLLSSINKAHIEERSPDKAIRDAGDALREKSVMTLQQAIDMHVSAKIKPLNTPAVANAQPDGRSQSEIKSGL